MLKTMTIVMLGMIASALPVTASLGAEETGSAAQPQTRSMDIMGWDHKIDSPRDASDNTDNKQTPVTTAPAVIKQPTADTADQVGKFREPTKHPAK